MNPLYGYLESEVISYNKLKEFVQGLANATSKLFNERLVTLSNKIFDRNPEYYDDFHYFRNRVFKNISDEFANVNPISTVIKTLRDLRMNVKKICYDSEDRINKYPSPICFFILIPSDIRILHREESPYFDFQGCFHGSGQVVHVTSINPNLEYKKYHIPMGINEIFSIFLERLTRNKKYLKKIKDIK